MKIAAPRSAFSGNVETTTIELFGHTWDIDVSIVRLVKTLHECGVRVSAGNGSPHGGWSVGFPLDRSQSGWRALDKIAHAAARCPGVTITAWYNGDENSLPTRNATDFSLQCETGEWRADEMADALDLVFGRRAW